ncbi:MAG TPA: nucleotidyltransferase family protein [Acetobacteraceae bacterium]|nr:nucleotidyltransferase family protein [Acetobacteraceae bacterium]
MSVRPRTAMLLAAGIGQRMRPLTEHTAKPLLTLGGRALIDHALDHLAEAGVETVVVNAFWQADRVGAHLKARAKPPRTLLRHETALLDTGAGTRAALDMLGHDPFYVVNGDAFWLNATRPALLRLAAAFDETVDGVLLVHRTFQVHADVGFGDFAVDPWGNLRRRREREVVPYVYAGVQLIVPALLQGMPEGPFSMNQAWDSAMAAGRLRAVVHDGLWFHLSTPADLADAESVLQARLTGETR